MTLNCVRGLDDYSLPSMALRRIVFDFSAGWSVNIEVLLGIPNACHYTFYIDPTTLLLCCYHSYSSLTHVPCTFLLFGHRNVVCWPKTLSSLLKTSFTLSNSILTCCSENWRKTAAAAVVQMMLPLPQYRQLMPYVTLAWMRAPPISPK